MKQHIFIPPQVQALLRQLNAAGFAADAVGGCVRDSLLGRTPQDWDLCTSARPEQTISCFAGDRTILTGLRYGTVTVVRDGVSYEITTYRAESGYTDSRHPSQVAFLSALQEDLRRRDFTINAMAADADGHVTDLFGGQEDLARRLIRCVGEPEQRFSEDALRMLRGLRFAAQLGFSVELSCARAIHALRHRLDAVAGERLRKELSGLVTGPAAASVLREFPDVLCVLIPELGDCVGFRQYNYHHRWDVWEHTLRVLDAAPPEEGLRLAALLHDAGKPAAFTLDCGLTGHFYGHAIISAALTERILRRLRYDRETADFVTALVRLHDYPLPREERAMRRMLARHGQALTEALIQLHQADRIGTGTCDPDQAAHDAAESQALLERTLEAEHCFCLRDLKLTGNDLMAMGVPQGPAVGRLLQWLLEQVLDGQLPNEYDALAQAVQSHL